MILKFYQTPSEPGGGHLVNQCESNGDHWASQHILICRLNDVLRRVRTTTSSSLTRETPKRWRRTCLHTTTCSTWWSCWPAFCSWCCRCARLPPCPRCVWTFTWVNAETLNETRHRGLAHSLQRFCVRRPLAGPRYSRASGVSHGGVWVMHETALVRLPHLHQTQEDNGEGNFAATFFFVQYLNCTVLCRPSVQTLLLLVFIFLFIVSPLLAQTCVLLLQFVEAIVVLVRQTSHLRVTRALRPIFLVDCRYCGAVRRYSSEDSSI